jgi:thioredoxin reductase (NADPH)
MYDVAIIGTGPAGISAALTLKALKKNIILFGSISLSEKIRRAEQINNYPGLNAISGEDFAGALSGQLKSSGIEITDKQVTGIYNMDSHYGVLCNTEVFEAYSVILASGVEPIKALTGELEFLGRGVSYCATCDGSLYKGKTIAVVCTSSEYADEVKYLSELAEKIYLFPLYKNPNISCDNIEIVRGIPKEIIGNFRAERLIHTNGELDVDGIFMLKSAISPSALIQGIEVKDGHVTVERDCSTNLSGVFAAGDCTGRPYQYAKAVGEGNVAAHSAVKYLFSKND